MNNKCIKTRTCLALAATVIASQLRAYSQALDTQILLPDPLISPTSLRPFAYGKAILPDPVPNLDRPSDYQSLYLGTLTDPTVSSTIWRIDPDSNAAPPFSAFSITPLDARLRFVHQLAYSPAEKVLYAVGEGFVQNTKPKSTSLAWMVRKSGYTQSGDANAWADAEPPFTLAKGAQASAQSIALDSGGTIYVSGRADDVKAGHTIIRRKAIAGGWSTVYDKINSVSTSINTALGYFPGSATAPAAILMVGNENNRWTIARSVTGLLGSWTAVDAAFSAANSPAGAKDITFDPQSGKIYVVGYKGTYGVGANGWVVRASADGGQTWNSLLDVSGPPVSWADSITVGAAGDVFVLGQFGVPSANNTWVPQMHLVHCTNSNDILSWQSSFAGVSLPFNELNCYDSLGHEVTVDPSGAIFVTGKVGNWTDPSLSTTYPGANVGLLRLSSIVP